MSSLTDSQIAPLTQPNAKLVTLSIIAGSGTGQSVDLHRAMSLVGSRSGCKLTLRHPDVSCVHCAIVHLGEEIYLRDLVSESGTYLNGLQAECEKLSDGDVIKVAQWEIAVQIQDPVPDDSTGSSVISLEPSPTVLALKGENEGPLVKLNRQVNVIGRKSGSDFVVHDNKVSRTHAIMFVLNSHAVICDLLSENGLWINGVPNRFGVLHSGDTIAMGASKMRVVIPSPTVAVSRRGGTSMIQSKGDTAMNPSSDQSDLIDIRAAELERG
ncbi:MAG: FHA domain-containing protein [Phycisphaerae bacterium]|nr:FHA domain-containing protein [Phycisphaerae bacterium]